MSKEVVALRHHMVPAMGAWHVQYEEHSRSPGACATLVTDRAIAKAFSDVRLMLYPTQNCLRGVRAKLIFTEDKWYLAVGAAPDKQLAVKSPIDQLSSSSGQRSCDLSVMCLLQASHHGNHHSSRRWHEPYPAVTQIENELLRQTVLDLRRAMRECNCTSPGVELYSDQLGPNLRLLPKFTQSAASDENEASAESGRHDRAFGFGSLQAESIVSEAAGQTSRTTEPQASGASTEAAVVSIKPNRERSDQLHGGAESTSSSLQSQGSLAEQSLASQELSVARNRHEPQRHGAQDRLEAAQSEAFSD